MLFRSTLFPYTTLFRSEIIGGMTIYKDAELKAYLEQAGFHEVQIHKKKSWLCITVRK